MSTLATVGRELASGFSRAKHACRVVSTSNITLSGLQTIDGVALAVGDRVLVAGQTSAAENGIRVVASTAWERANDANMPNKIILGMETRILEGTAYAGSVWALTSPTTGIVSLNVTALVFTAQDGGEPAAPLPSTASVIQPSGVTTGATDRAAIQAALTAGRQVYLVPGATYYIDQTVIVPTGARIRCTGPGRAIVQPAAAWAPAGGSADDRTIELFQIEGVVGSTVNTTLATIAQADSRQINPTATTGMVDGMWLVLQGTGGNAGNGDVYNNSSGEAVEEIVRLSGAPSGGWVTLATPKRTHHRITGTTVKDVTPVEDVEISGIDFRTTGNHACAIAARYARDIRIDNVSFTGFARAGMDAIGCHAITVGHVHNGGGNNSLFRFTTSQHCSIGDGSWTFDPDAVRCHTNGIPKAQLNFTGQCVANTLNPGVLGRGTCAVRICGGWGNLTRAFHAIDFDSRLAKTRDPSTLNSRTATGYEGAYGDTSAPDAAEFGHGNALEGIVCVNHRHEDNAGAWNTDSGCSVFLHDDYAASVGFIQLVNKGHDYADTENGDSNYGCYGISIQDWMGTIGPISTVGVSYAFQTHGTWAYARCSTMLLDGTAGRAIGIIPIYFNHATEGAGPTGMNVTINSFTGRVRFGASFADPMQRIDELTVDSTSVHTDLQATYFSAATNVGDIVEITSTGTTATTKRRAAPAAGATTAPGVCGIGGALDVSTGWGMVANLPGRFNTVRFAGDYNAGATCETDANADAVSPATAYDKYIGRVVKKTGGAGLGVLGP